MGQANILGNTLVFAVVLELWKNDTASDKASLILKNCEKPKSWNISYTLGWISNKTILAIDNNAQVFLG